MRYFTGQHLHDPKSPASPEAAMTVLTPRGQRGSMTFFQPPFIMAALQATQRLSDKRYAAESIEAS